MRKIETSVVQADRRGGGGEGCKIEKESVTQRGSDLTWSCDRIGADLGGSYRADDRGCWNANAGYLSRRNDAAVSATTTVTVRECSNRSDCVYAFESRMLERRRSCEERERESIKPSANRVELRCTRVVDTLIHWQFLPVFVYLSGQSSMIVG